MSSSGRSRSSPLNPEAYHNRGVIHERRNATRCRRARVRSALRYRPGYEPRTARCSGCGAPPVETAAAPHREARDELAERASEAARRGDYDGAA